MMQYFSKRALPFFLFFLPLPACQAAMQPEMAPALSIKQLNDELRHRAPDLAQNGGFVNRQGHILFEGGVPPGWATDQALSAIGLKPGWGAGGVNPYRLYTKDEYKGTGVSKFLRRRGYTKCVWDQNIGHGQRAPGIGLLQHLFERAGENALQELHDMDSREERWRTRLEFFTNNLVPTACHTLSQPSTMLATFLVVLFFLGVPLVIWNASKAFFKVLFVPRPVVLGEKDSDIYGHWLKRLLFRYPALPEVIVNPPLQEELAGIVANNKKVAALNKSGKQTPYPHIVAYGEPGVGKTLFAKKLAQQSGMHFMYFTMGDLSQMREEEALRTLKELFAYARKFAPCVLIIDEADILFSRADSKAQRLTQMFQKEFSRAVDEKVQLFLITNHPGRLPAPILNRIARKVHFDAPDLATKRKLFDLHIPIALKAAGLKDPIFWDTSYCGEVTLADLVGRDIEAIAFAFVLSEQKSLTDSIARYKKEREALKAFAKVPEPPVASTPPENNPNTPTHTREIFNW